MFNKKSLLVLASLVLAFGMLVGCATDDTEPGLNDDVETPTINPGGETEPGSDTDVDTEDGDEEVDTEDDNG